ncbi:MAG: Zn-dependent M28 family amino/carboxypeptidase, partial [Candidatus Azotimanducaceae bacterium]
ALASITGAEIRTHMEVLAADDMAGREAGTQAYERAANYVATQYESVGLKPMGDDGTYFQNINFMESRLDPTSARLSFHKQGATVPLVFRDDFTRSAGFGDTDDEASAELVFIGYGIVAPELGHDDYAGVDVEGKILVALTGAPPGFGTDQRAYYSSGRGKAALAEARGAIGRISIRTPVDQARRPWARYLPGIGSPGLRWLDTDGNPQQGFAKLRGSALLSETGTKKLFALSGHDVEALFEKHANGRTGSFDLGVSASLTRTSTQRQVSSANVVAVLEGQDPELKNEYLVYTGHLDHIGLRPGNDGDEIHNGAYDNASGVGSILSIARAMSAMPTGPRRSVIFAMVTAEEKGLRGSNYFTHNLPVPADRLVANINIDMPYLGFPVNDVHAFGAEHSTLFAPAEQATKYLGMTLTPDPSPEEVRFVRSDQFSFVLKGIPAVALKPGTMSADPAIDGKAALADFLKNHYHQSSDDLSQPFNSQAAQRFAQAGLLMGLIVADDEKRPRWLENDFFGDKFAQ